MRRISKTVLAVLVKNNWNEKKLLNPTKVREVFSEFSFFCNRKAEQFLRRFLGTFITYQNPRSPELTNSFNCKMESVFQKYSNSHIEYYEEKLKVEGLSLVGELIEEYMCLLMTSDGKVYGAYEDLILFFGDDYAEALENIFFRKDQKKISDNKPYKIKKEHPYLKL